VAWRRSQKGNGGERRENTDNLAENFAHYLLGTDRTNRKFGKLLAEDRTEDLADSDVRIWNNLQGFLVCLRVGIRESQRNSRYAVQEYA
jgi:hypothetical protein